MTAVERPAAPPVRTHKADRTWVGKSIRSDPAVAIPALREAVSS